jgi:CBS domain containing-hemolysin-like protein
MKRILIAAFLLLAGAASAAEIAVTKSNPSKITPALARAKSGRKSRATQLFRKCSRRCKGVRVLRHASSMAWTEFRWV